MDAVMTGPVQIASPAVESPVTGRRKWIIAGLAAVTILALAGWALYEGLRPAEIRYRTTSVVRADVTERVTATGTLQPVITSPVGAQVSGIVWKLHADYNSTVKAGDLLVELDPALFRNSVALATAQLAQARADLASTRATAHGAGSVRDRTTQMERRALVSPADLDAAQATFGQTSGLARSSLAQVAGAQAQLARAELDLEHSIIRSPVDGTVISRNIDVGQAVAATLTAPTLFTIAQDLHHMQVHAAVDEADIGGVRPEQTATFTVDAFRDDIFQARVREVRNAPQTAQNVVTYDVVLDVENPEEKLRPGMTANVLILIVQKKQVVAVPNEALRFRPAAGTSSTSTSASTQTSPGAPAGARQGAAVYVLVAGRAERAAVKTGVTDGNLTEVWGLEPGATVILDVLRGKGAGTPAGAAPPGGAARGS
jgi:HlyD family secretion protein